MKISDAIRNFLLKAGGPHSERYHQNLEVQINPVDEQKVQESGIVGNAFRIRLPQDGDSAPKDNDGEMPYPTELVQQIGVSGWNWRDRQTEFVIFDFDAQEGHKKKGLTPEELKQVQDAASRLPYVRVHRSKSGRGLHFYVELETPVASPTRKEHSLVARAILAKMSADIEFDLVAKCDAKGVIGWIWDRDAAGTGFTLVKAAEHKLIDVPAWEPPSDDSDFASVTLDGQHDELVLWLTKRGLADWDAAKQRLNTHTHALRLAHEALGLEGEFATIAVGSDGPGDRNCFCFPKPKGAWFVCRHSPGVQEAESWQTSPAGWTCCDLNKKAVKQSTQNDDELLIVMAEEADELFCSNDGRAFVTFRDVGNSYTLLIEEEDYQDCLRRRFRAKYKRPVDSRHINNAIRYLRAIAKSGSKYPVAVRLASHGGNIYIDLCNGKGQVIEVAPDRWQVLDEAPVRFRRSRTMAALPVPVTGHIDLLREFCHVTEEDWPLIVGWLVAALRPEGPFTILSFEGRAGSAKSTMARVCKALVDPSTCELSGEPNNIEDLMLQAFKSWIVAYDNLSQLDQHMSDALCRLSTGGSYIRRKVFTPEDQTTFSVKNPVVISSVKGVITARDLVDRALLITLPAFKDGEPRLSERDFNAKFAHAYPAILGALLNGVSTALRNLPTVKVAESARMADFAEWVTAAETGLGFDPGTIMAAYKRMRLRAAAVVLDNPLGKALVALAQEGWVGTAKELSEKLGSGAWPSDPKKLAGEVRMLATDLEKLGVVIADRIVSGRTTFYMSAGSVACFANDPSPEPDELGSIPSDPAVYYAPGQLIGQQSLYAGGLLETVAQLAPFLNDVGVKVEIEGDWVIFVRS